MSMFLRAKADRFRSFPNLSKPIRGMVASATILFSTSVMGAGSSAGYDLGGKFARFDAVVRQYNQTGELFRIQGDCKSACTLFLAIRNVCIEPSATLYFHAGRDPNENITAASTAHMVTAYNAKLRAFVRANRYMEALDFHEISGTDLIQKFGYKACPKT
jgi:hypothetical protein